MDIAVGIIIGAEFTAIIASLVDNLANPLIGLFLGRVNFTDMYAVLSGDVPQGTSLDAMRESGAGATVMRLRPAGRDRWTYQSHDVHTLESYIDSWNYRSQAVAKRLGAVTDGTRADHEPGAEVWRHLTEPR